MHLANRSALPVAKSISNQSPPVREPGLAALHGVGKMPLLRTVRLRRAAFASSRAADAVPLGRGSINADFFVRQTY